MSLGQSSGCPDADSSATTDVIPDGYAEEMDRVFAAGGEVGRLMAALDWSATPLGPVCGWCPGLRMVVGTCLESKFPLLILWGPDLIEIHNDAFTPMMGGKYPGNIGQPFRDVFPELAEVLAPMFKQVLSERGATLFHDWPALLSRDGFLEECYFTFSQSPIRQVPGGDVGGILTAIQETTQQVLGTRRLSSLRELASATAGRRRTEEVFARAAEVVGRCSADIPYGMILLRDQRTRHPKLLPAATTGLVDPPKSLYRPEPLDAVPELGDTLTSGRIRLIDQLPERLALRPTGSSPLSRSAIAIPLTERVDAPPIGLFVAGISDRLPLDAEYRTFLALIAAQIAAAVTSTRAAEKERAMVADARHRALHDGLTGLANRTALFDQLDRTLTESRRSGQGVGFLFVDLDGFKNVNDTLGHCAGDDLLREVAGQLRQAVRPGDLVARLGGDEFAVLCQNITSTRTVDAVADHIIRVISKLRTQAGRTIAVTASVGMALSGPGLFDPDALVRAADTAMYAAKRQGPSRRLLFDPLMPARGDRTPGLPQNGA